MSFAMGLATPVAYPWLSQLYAKRKNALINSIEQERPVVSIDGSLDRDYQRVTLEQYLDGPRKKGIRANLGLDTLFIVSTGSQMGKTLLFTLALYTASNFQSYLAIAVSQTRQYLSAQIRDN